MGSSSPPQTTTPGQSAQAAIGTTAAGEQMSIADQPVEQYSNVATTGTFGPTETQQQQALANQAARQAASGQMAIQSAVDPQAYAQRQMRMQAANQRLGQLYGQDPTAFTYSDPNAFTVPGTSGLPALGALSQQGQAIASNLATASVNSKGGNPQVVAPGKGQRNPATTGATYYQA